ncbi:putative RNA-directed DNA polymerase, partial [Tanacetum coccineum]
MGEEGYLAVVGNWKGKNGLVGFINVYGSHDIQEKANLWLKLSKVINSIDAAWCIFGDFNEVRSREERRNSGFNKRGAVNFNNFINGECLIDIPMGGKKFTRISDDGLKFSKIDRFLTNSLFCQNWVSLVVIAKERKLSDHCLLVLMDKIIDFGPKPFRCFDVWMEEKECEDIVKDCWEKRVFSVNPDSRFRDKLKNVKEGLKTWSKIKFGGDLDEIERLKNEATKWELIAKSRELDEIELDRWKEARKGWVEKYKRKNDMIKQKARSKWVLEGDENSKFFHACMRNNTRKTSLKGLLVDGRWCEDPTTLKTEVYNFFKNTFKETNEDRPCLNNSSFNRISTPEKDDLERDVYEEEIWEAVKQCGSKKAPGPDGFNFGFLKKYWGIIKTDLIISKILAERMKKVICKVIGEEQNAFIQGRYILDGGLIATEACEYLKKEKKKAFLLKVDFEKAYDSVNFIQNTLLQMGFGERWCKWVQTCQKSASVSVLVNGSPTLEFKMERGVRQGDPLSPFLYLVAAEGLNVTLKDAVRNGLFKGVKIGRSDIPISHLQYAEDTLIFGEWKESNAKNLMRIME